MAILIQQQVLGLEITVGDATLLLVEELEDEDDLGGVEAGDGLVEAAQLSEVGEELAAGDVIEEHVQGIVVGERSEEVGDEGVPGDIGEDGAFVAHVVDLLEANDLGLAQDLERVHFGVELVIEGDVSRGGGANEADAGKGSC